MTKFGLNCSKCHFGFRMQLEPSTEVIASKRCNMESYSNTLWALLTKLLFWDIFAFGMNTLGQLNFCVTDCINWPYCAIKWMAFRRVAQISGMACLQIGWNGYKIKAQIEKVKRVFKILSCFNRNSLCGLYFYIYASLEGSCSWFETLKRGLWLKWS